MRRTAGIRMGRPVTRGRAGALLTLLVVLITLAACSLSSPAPPPVPASPLAGARRITCLTASPSCTAPGTVRWSLPVHGSYAESVGDSAVLDMAAAAGVRESFQNEPPGGPHPVAFTGGMAVICASGAAEGVDAATGQVRWQRVFSSRPGNGFVNAQGVCNPAVAAPGTVALENFLDYPSAQDPDRLWILDAATGAVQGRLSLPVPPGGNPGDTRITVLTVAGGIVSVLEGTRVFGLSEANGTTRWQDTLQPGIGSAVIGDILYADNEPPATARPPRSHIQRVNLSTGVVLPPLRLSGRLRGAAAAVIPPSQFVTAAGGPLSLPATRSSVAGAGPAGILLVQQQPTTKDGYSDLGASDSVAAVDPATGRTLWKYPGDMVRIDPASTPPTLALVQLPVSGYGPLQDGPWWLRVVNLATGALIASTTVARSVRHGINGLNQFASNLSTWNYYGGDVIIENEPTGRKEGSHAGWYGRLEGVAPTGRARWTGPWSASDFYVLGDAQAGPHLIIVEACAPAAIVAGNNAHCTRGWVYAVNT